MAVRVIVDMANSRHNCLIKSVKDYLLKLETENFVPYITIYGDQQFLELHFFLLIHFSTNL